MNGKLSNLQFLLMTAFLCVFLDNLVLGHLCICDFLTHSTPSKFLLAFFLCENKKSLEVALDSKRAGVCFMLYQCSCCHYGTGLMQTQKAREYRERKEYRRINLSPPHTPEFTLFFLPYLFFFLLLSSPPPLSLLF